MAKKIDKKKPVKKPAAAARKAAPVKKAAKVVKKSASAKPAAVKKMAKSGGGRPVPAQTKAAPPKKTVAKGHAKAPSKPVVKKPVEARRVQKKASSKAGEIKPAESKTTEIKAPEKPQAKPIVAKVEARKKQKAPEVEEVAVSADEVDDEADAESEEIVLTDAEGRRYCRVKDCDQLSSVDGYCRYHYLLYWKKIQVRKKILTEGKLERYVEELTSRYPDKFLETLRKDLRSDKDFQAAIQELEIDESAIENDLEDETQNYIDEVRGMAEPGARDEEDF